MVFKKIVKKFGNSLVIVFNKENCESYDIREGDIIDISDLTVIHLKQRRNKK